MTSEQQTIDRLHGLWRHQLVATLTLTPEQLLGQNVKLRRTLRNYVIAEYLGAAVAVVSVGLAWWHHAGSWLTKACYVSVLACVPVALYSVQRHLAAERPSPGADLLAFQRRALERLRTSTQTSWRWYLPLFLPTFVLIALDRWFFDRVPGRPIELDRLIIVMGVFFIVAVLAGCVLWAQLVAARLQRAIDYLDVFRREG